MDILDFFGTFYLNHLSPLWGYFLSMQLFFTIVLAESTIYVLFHQSRIITLSHLLCFLHKHLPNQFHCSYLYPQISQSRITILPYSSLGIFACYPSQLLSMLFLAIVLLESTCTALKVRLH